MTMTPLPPRLLHEDVQALAERRLAGRRWVDPAAVPRFQAFMRNDFLTPRGKPYKWQEMSAGYERRVVDGRVPTVVPVEYQWERVDVRTGTPKAEGDWREWTFARAQTFASTLLHTELDGPPPVPADPGGPPPPALDLSYRLPKSPALDLLRMLSWDVVAMEMLCTHLTTTSELREVGGHTELERLSGSWAELEFSDPGLTALFRNARTSGRHLGYGRFAGRPTAVYTVECLDSVLDVKTGPVAQRGRSSYWATVQADIETRDLLAAEMTEVIIATLTGPDGARVPIQKRRSVRVWAGSEDSPRDAPQDPVPSAGGLAGLAGRRSGAAVGLSGPAGPVGSVGPVGPAGSADPADQADPAETAALTQAMWLSGRARDYLAWQMTSLEHLPPGMAELAQMGFRSVVGTDLPDTFRQIRPLIGDLRAVAEGRPGARTRFREALPRYRRLLEGLLAFGQLAVDGATRQTALDQAGRDASRDHLGTVGDALSELLALLDQWERPERHGPPADAHAAHAAHDADAPADALHRVTDPDLPEQP
jgi:hypothetical protein